MKSYSPVTKKGKEHEEEENKWEVLWTSCRNSTHSFVDIPLAGTQLITRSCLYAKEPKKYRLAICPRKRKHEFDEELAISVKLGIIYFDPISHLIECGSESSVLCYGFGEWVFLPVEIFNEKLLFRR